MSLLKGLGGTACFVAIPYTGTRSVADALGIERRHITAAKAGELYPDAALFSVVRNPLDHAVSYFVQTTGSSDVAWFRRWLAESYRGLRLSLPDGETVHPLDQDRFLRHGGPFAVNLFPYPRLSEAVLWACDHCGVRLQRVVPWLGRSRTSRDWREWYDTASEKLVLSTRASDMEIWESLT